MPPDSSAQDRTAQLQTDLADCVMNNSWFWCLSESAAAGCPASHHDMMQLKLCAAMHLHMCNNDASACGQLVQCNTVQ